MLVENVVGRKQRLIIRLYQHAFFIYGKKVSETFAFLPLPAPGKG